MCAAGGDLCVCAADRRLHACATHVVDIRMPEPSLDTTMADLEASHANTTRSGNAALTNRIERVSAAQYY